MRLFQYGENSSLSRAEILSVVGRLDRFRDMGDYAIVEGQVKNDLRLGSVLRVAKFLCLDKDLERSLEESLPVERRTRWAVTNLDCAGAVDIEARIEACLPRVNGRWIRIRPLSRFGRNNGLSITRAISNKMAAKGVEFLLSCSEGVRRVWTTESYVPLSDFKRADMRRPYKRSIIALPTHLARTMINLAKPSRGDNLLDPFCGTGTVLMEALTGQVTAYGVDRDAVNIRGCITNLKWRGFHQSSYHVVRGDSLRLGSLFPELRFDCVVTEPPLGPPISELPSQAQGLRLRDSLTPFYERALKSIVTVLKEGARVVMTLPSWKIRGGQRVAVDANLLAVAAGLVVDDSLTQYGVRYPIRWAKPDNKIERLVTVFTKD